MIGGYDLEKAYGITWNRIVDYRSWIIQASELHYGSSKITMSSKNVLIDSGESQTVIPERDFNSIIKTIKT